MLEHTRSIRRRRARPTQEQFVFPNGWGGRRKGSGPKNQFDTRKAIEFFDRDHIIREMHAEGLDNVLAHGLEIA